MGDEVVDIEMERTGVPLAAHVVDGVGVPIDAWAVEGPVADEAVADCDVGVADFCRAEMVELFYFGRR